ncbi:MAG TPA: hypothetical protein VIT68_04070 [Candidatus Gracilibacteria bacterium]
MRKPKKITLITALKNHVESLLDTHHGQLRKFPNSVIVLVYVMCLNILLQGFLDIFVKFGAYTPWIVDMPWRIDFLFLTAISVLMGFQTLNGMKEQKLDVTRNSIHLGLLVEASLVIGDLHFISVYQTVIPEVFWFRMPFIILTIFNIWILGYIFYRMHLFADKDGHIKLF